MRSMAAYRTQFWIELLGASARFATGMPSLAVIFSTVETINGWSEASAGVVLGVFFCSSSSPGCTTSSSVPASARGRDTTAPS